MDDRSQRWWDLPSALLLTAALLSAAIRLHVTNWTENLAQIEFVVLIAVILGLALGKSIFRGWVAFGMGAVFTITLLGWQLVVLQPEMAQWAERLYYLYARLYWAIADFLRNQPVKDPILFITAMFLLYWLASIFAAYGLVRKANPWFPLLVIGLMILVIEYTVELYAYVKITGGTYSFFYLLFTLTLMGRLYFLRSRREWEKRGGTVELEVGFDLGRGVLISAVALVLIAWNAPALFNVFGADNPAQERISREFQALRDRVSKATNSLKSPGSMSVEGYGNNLFLGTGGPLSDEVAFYVTPGSGEKGNVRTYWTARTYDTYRNGQWVTTISGSQALGPTQTSLRYPQWDLHRNQEFSFNSRIPLLRTLYFPGAPLRVNRESKAIVSVNEEGRVDTGAIIMDPPLRSGESYTVTASVGEPNVDAMRQSGEEYPPEVTLRYLQLPENFSPRIAELAQQVAGSEKTRYDQVVAVTQYLRRTITYAETIQPPPTDRDPIEWFLFDYREGFCNYYASAEVLMLRSLGIPARMNVGYAQGSWDPEEGIFEVIGKDSHAWPEAYFPNLGWVIFEPTVSQPMVSFPVANLADSYDNGDASSNPINTFMTPTPNTQNTAQDILDQYRNRPDEGALASTISPWLVGLIVVSLLFAAAVLFEWRRRQVSTLPLPAWLERALDQRGLRTPDWLRSWARSALRTPMENLFANVATMLRVWGQPVEPAQTPAEQIHLLVQLVPVLQPSAAALLEEYEKALYSPYQANLLRARQAVDELRITGLKSWVLRLAGLDS